MRAIVISLGLVLASAARATAPLDEPLPPVASMQALVESFRVVEGKLGHGDHYAFITAWPELLEPLKHEDCRLSDSEWEPASLKVFSKLTPRQIILIGHQIRMLRAKYMLAGNRLEKPDTDAILKESGEILRRYTNEANHSPEPAPGAVH